MVTDDFHHWQLGILLVIVALLLKKYVRWYYKLLAVSIGMIIDESMYIFSPFYWRFNHYAWEGIVFEFVVLAVLALALVYIKPERSKSSFYKDKNVLDRPAQHRNSLKNCYLSRTIRTFLLYFNYGK